MKDGQTCCIREVNIVYRNNYWMLASNRREHADHCFCKYQACALTLAWQRNGNGWVALTNEIELE